MWIINKLLDQSGQLDPISSVGLQLLPSLIGLFGGQPRGARELSSMGRRGARAQAEDVGQARSIRKMLTQSAMGTFGVDPLQAKIAELRGGLPLLSGQLHATRTQQLAGLEGIASAGGTGGNLSPEQQELLRNMGIGGPAFPAGMSPFSTELPAGDRETLEAQFGRAKEDVLSSSAARGGSLASALQNVSIGRARELTQQTSQARERGRGLARQFLTGVADPDIASLLPAQQAAQAQSERAGAARTQALGSMGESLGGILERIFGRRGGASPTVSVRGGDPNFFRPPSGLFG